MATIIKTEAGINQVLTNYLAIRLFSDSLATKVLKIINSLKSSNLCL